MDMQIRIPFHIQKNTFDFASTISTIEPSNASVNPSDSMTIKIKCIISWSTEEKEEVYKKEKEKRKCFDAFYLIWSSHPLLHNEAGSRSHPFCGRRT